MIKIENTDVYGFEAAIRGMRSPMNSWEKSDSWHGCRSGDYGHIDSCDCEKRCRCDCQFCIGNNDLNLMKKLVSAGSDHSKFMRMITVTCDITAPRYWWTEFDTYKVGTVRNSCSTMHKIHEGILTLENFSHEHLRGEALNVLEKVIQSLNVSRVCFLSDPINKDYWWQIIQLLPQSYNQRATVQLNYQGLKNMYHARKSHKLDEWVDFCRWVEESLPYSELITKEE